MTWSLSRSGAGGHRRRARRWTDRRSIPDGPDLVVIATDASRHVEDALEALEAGARVVLVEKPVAAEPTRSVRFWITPCEAVRVCAPLRFRAGMSAVRDALTSLDRPGAVRIVSRAGCLTGDRTAISGSRTPQGWTKVASCVTWSMRSTTRCGSSARRAIFMAVGPTPSPVLGLPVDEAADLFWRAGADVSVSLRIDYVTRPTRRFARGHVARQCAQLGPRLGRVESVSALGEPQVLDLPVDRDPDTALAAQAQELLGLGAGQPAPRARPSPTASWRSRSVSTLELTIGRTTTSREKSGRAMTQPIADLLRCPGGPPL